MAKRHPATPQMVDAPVENQSELKCDTHRIETSISHLGEILEVPISVPRYTTFHTSTVATGKQGSGPGELDCPYGVAIHEDTHQIFIASSDNDRVEIFSETGEFLNQLGVGQLSGPRGIAINRDSLYISCVSDHIVSKFSLTETCRVRKIGSKGSNNGQFSHPIFLLNKPPSESTKLVQQSLPSGEIIQSFYVYRGSNPNLKFIAFHPLGHVIIGHTTTKRQSILYGNEIVRYNDVTSVDNSFTVSYMATTITGDLACASYSGRFIRVYPAD